jgi:Fe-S-cluster containining protein
MSAEASEVDREGNGIPTDTFSDWLARTRRARKSDAGADVPCGECRGCCTSSYFIHIRPDETETLSRIPKKLLFPAPGLPKGHKLLGYDEKGHCPMFIDNRCSIYRHRPQTCRDYDCRIFPATGLTLGDEKPAISRQAERWKFAFPEARDRAEFKAVRAAAEFLNAHAAEFPAGFVPGNPTQRAIVALKVYPVFLDPPRKPGKPGGKADAASLVAAVLAAFEKFES